MHEMQEEEVQQLTPPPLRLQPEAVCKLFFDSKMLVRLI